MDRNIAKQWAARLRAGTIKQTTNYLGRVDGSRCCLGVLCDMAVEQNIIPRPHPYVGDDPKQRGTLLYGKEDITLAYLPNEVINWANIDSAHATYPGGTHPSLAEANDAGFDFPHIANLIDENALYL